jgi:hypothetical protein
MQAPAKFRISSFQIVPFLRKKRTSPEKKTISLHQQISKEKKKGLSSQSSIVNCQTPRLVEIQRLWFEYRDIHAKDIHGENEGE